MFGSGYNASSFCPTGSMQDAAIIFPAMQPFWLGTVGFVSDAFSSVKFPCFIRGVGTAEFTVVAFRLVKFCASKKKKVRFLMTGPPIVPPNWFWLKCPRGTPPALLKKLFESRRLLRRNSHTSPRKAFDPLLIDALITAPADVPNSAE